MNDNIYLPLMGFLTQIKNQKNRLKQLRKTWL